MITLMPSSNEVARPHMRLRRAGVSERTGCGTSGVVRGRGTGRASPGGGFKTARDAAPRRRSRGWQPPLDGKEAGGGRCRGRPRTPDCAVSDGCNHAIAQKAEHSARVGSWRRFLLESPTRRVEYCRSERKSRLEPRAPRSSSVRPPTASSTQAGHLRIAFRTGHRTQAGIRATIRYGVPLQPKRKDDRTGESAPTSAQEARSWRRPGGRRGRPIT